MRLIRCHIENFGKLSDISLAFEDSCHIFCEENGWGKSTLATFLRVMFFGFNNEGKRDEVDNERKHYMPWQKGVYGGSVTFEVSGTTYEMSRQFGKKEKDDEFELRFADTNMVSTDFTTKIGEEMFQIDSESFQRTVFISQQHCDTKTTDGINAKMGNLVDNTDDITNFATVYDKLKKKTDSMVPNRKTGSLHKLKSEISDLAFAIRAEEDITKRMEDTEKLRALQCENSRDKQKQIEQIEKKQKTLADDMDVRNKRTEYRALCDMWQQEQDNLTQVQRQFANPDCIPEEADLQERQRQEKTCRELAGFVRQNTLSEEERTQYEQWQDRFTNNLPSEEQLGQMERGVEDLQKMRRELASSQLSEEELSVYQSIQNRYGENIPEESDVLSLRSRWEEARRKEEGLAAKRATLSTLSQMTEQKKRGGISLPAILGIIVACLGLAGFFVQVIAGAICLVIGLALVLFGVFSVRKDDKKDNGENDELQTLAAQIEEDEHFIQTVQTDVENFLSAYNRYEGKENVIVSLDELLRDVRRFSDLQAKRGNATQGIKEERCEKLALSIREFIQKYESQYCAEESFGTQLARIRADAERWQAWHNKEKDYKKAKEAYDEQYSQLTEYLSYLGYETVEDAEMLLQRLRQLAHEYQSAKMRYALANERKESFEQKHDVEKLMTETEEDVANGSMTQLTEQLNEAREAKEAADQLIREYDKRLQEDQEKWDEILQLKVELADKEERYEADYKNFTLLRKTMDYLQMAKESLTARYMEPVKKGFDKYYEMIVGKSAENYRFDADVNVTVLEQGLQRDTRFLSEGHRDLVGICTRMALIDAMYEGEKPFIIFDDPFVNLDKEKTEKAMAFLKEISREYQVIYFTCHATRS